MEDAARGRLMRAAARFAFGEGLGRIAASSNGVATDKRTSISKCAMISLQAATASSKVDGESITARSSEMGKCGEFR